ncbi:hypothetical protein FCM35_KLT19309 [Carex littledalei]|uniref:Uncharacterized protein n=1 Tax=Carex littledalei TaxID=544730 RepID=A0A833RBP8_9POAL|nr:hypothetical protein FCM35_KLT19309 [Carex littledalei]
MQCFQKSLHAKLRLLYPDVIIIYANYYEASMNIFRSPKKLGCVPMYLTLFQSRKKEDYDSETECFNAFRGACKASASIS